jgi:hypothetical protein
MLDALVAEARLRWGLDLAAGLQVVAAERLIATPLEPSRPALVVPLSVLRAEGPADAPEPEPLPGRHGPSGRDPLALLVRLYPADHAVGRFGAADGTTVAGLTAEDLATPLYLAPVAPGRLPPARACRRAETTEATPCIPRAAPPAGFASRPRGRPRRAPPAVGRAPGVGSRIYRVEVQTLGGARRNGLPCAQSFCKFRHHPR